MSRAMLFQWGLANRKYPVRLLSAVTSSVWRTLWPTEIKSWTISLWRPSPEELYWYRTKPCSACHCNLLDAQIPQCIEKYRTMHHFATEMCTFAHVCYKMVHCGLWDWCTVEFLRHEITYPLPIFNSTVEIWEWINNFIPPFIVETVTYNTCVKVKGTSLANVCLEKFCWRLAEQSRDKATVGSNRRGFLPLISMRLNTRKIFVKSVIQYAQGNMHMAFVVFCFGQSVMWFTHIHQTTKTIQAIIQVEFSHKLWSQTDRLSLYLHSNTMCKLPRLECTTRSITKRYFVCKPNC